MKTLVLHVLAFYLTWLSAAAPLADEPVSNPLTKRAATCSAEFGRDMDHFDCMTALSRMRRMEFVSTNPAEARGFSRIFHPNNRYQIPQFFKSGSCTIVLDLVSDRPNASLRVEWGEAVWAGARDVIADCVSLHRTGGEIDLGGFRTSVVNEENMNEDYRNGLDQCRVTLKNNAAMQEQIDCRLRKAIGNVMLGWNDDRKGFKTSFRSGSGSSSGTSK